MKTYQFHLLVLSHSLHHYFQAAYLVLQLSHWTLQNYLSHSQQCQHIYPMLRNESFSLQMPIFDLLEDENSSRFIKESNFHGNFQCPRIREENNRKISEIGRKPSEKHKLAKNCSRQHFSRRNSLRFRNNVRW